MISTPHANRAQNELAPVPVCVQCGGHDADVILAGCFDRRHGLPGLFDIVRCSTCHLVRTTPQPTKSTMKQYYPGSYLSFSAEEPVSGTAYGAARWVVRLPYRLRYGPPDELPAPPHRGARALDVWCGTGVTLAELGRRSWGPWGLEQDERAASAARRRLAPTAARSWFETPRTQTPSRRRPSSS